VDDKTVAAYLTRIGAERAAPSVAALRELSERHLMSVPFENLSIHLGELIELTPEALADKIIRRRRGGFCYELNGLFAELLTALGYDVTLQSARVFSGDTLGVPFDHLALRVDVAGPWVVDIGFGRHAVYPLRLDERDAQVDPDGVFLVRDAEFGDLDVLRNGEPVYRMETRPRTLSDFDATCWYQQTSPESTFTKNTVCTLARPDGRRVTLSGSQLIHTTVDDRSEEDVSDSDALAVYRDVFGFELDRVPELSIRA
jgi:N-hydroxyarylamine O-acetyltransferase